MSHYSKIYDRIIFNQISTYFETYFLNLLTGFRKNHSTQHSWLKILELWKEALDKRESVCAIYIDLSKAFDTLKHSLIIILIAINSKTIINNSKNNNDNNNNSNNNKTPWSWNFQVALLLGITKRFLVR